MTWRLTTIRYYRDDLLMAYGCTYYVHWNHTYSTNSIDDRQYDYSNAMGHIPLNGENEMIATMKSGFRNINTMCTLNNKITAVETKLDVTNESTFAHLLRDISLLTPEYLREGSSSFVLALTFIFCCKLFSSLQWRS